VLEIYSDAETFGLKSANPVAVNNSNRAISWLEATFPELAHESKEGGLSTLKAHPYAVFDASLCLQVIFILFLTFHIPCSEHLKYSCKLLRRVRVRLFGLNLLLPDSQLIGKVIKMTGKFSELLVFPQNAFSINVKHPDTIFFFSCENSSLYMATSRSILIGSGWTCYDFSVKMLLRSCSVILTSLRI
jgi:hypothetical protein